MHQTIMEFFVIFQVKKKKKSRHLYRLVQRLGPFPASQERHAESVCHIYIQKKHFI